LIANPLLDAWVVIDGDALEVAPVPARRAAEPPPAVRIGELLFFTTLMSPWAISDDAHSRFTCETCHWEGYGDGRIHYTGRDDVHATTRPLRGLAQGRPYFSRALDPTMTDMVHAEFGVAARGTGQPSWFAVDRALAPWLARVPGAAASLSPLDLRGAFMAFLGVFGHEANPVVAGRTAFAPEERRGAEVFRDRCEACHQARLVVDRAETRVGFDHWERLVMSPSGPLTWARDTRYRTGVTPYVHADGARVPALRRLYRKYPYFTNGSSPSLDHVVARVRLGADVESLQHAGETGAPLVAEERAALLAFLRLL
jgi:cytochrome c peroxidase